MGYLGLALVAFVFEAPSPRVAVTARPMSFAQPYRFSLLQPRGEDRALWRNEFAGIWIPFAQLGHGRFGSWALVGTPRGIATECDRVPRSRCSPVTFGMGAVQWTHRRVPLSLLGGVLVMRGTRSAMFPFAGLSFPLGRAR